MSYLDKIQNEVDFDIQDETDRVDGAVTDLRAAWTKYKEALKRGHMVRAEQALTEVANMCRITRAYATDMKRAISSEHERSGLEERRRFRRRPFTS